MSGTERQATVSDSTREDYLGRFSNVESAVEYENTCLSAIEPCMEGVPECAIRVRAGGEPTPEYWQWLCSQVDLQDDQNGPEPSNDTAPAPEPIERLAWGLQPDVPCVAAWGARAILQDDFRGGLMIDILHDRQANAGPKAELHKLCQWCNDTGLPILRKRIKELGLRPDERRLVVIERPGLRLIANPNASYGYLYICAMLLPTGGKGGAT